MAGRRLTDTVKAALEANGVEKATVLLMGIVNGYTSYITTFEEYSVSWVILNSESFIEIFYCKKLRFMRIPTRQTTSSGRPNHVVLRPDVRDAIRMSLRCSKRDVPAM